MPPATDSRCTAGAAAAAGAGAGAGAASSKHAVVPPASPLRSKALEQAALPDVTPEQRKKMLSFVVVSALRIARMPATSAAVRSCQPACACALRCEPARTAAWR